MLTLLGVAAIVALLALILFRVTSVVVALTLVPIAAGVAAGSAGQIGGFAMDGIRSVAPTAALLAFAVVYFGVMNDAGLFEPFIRSVVRLVGHDPVKVVVGTAAIAAIAHLDGAGASTFMVTVPAMLPIYARLRMDPVVLTCTVALSAGTMNILPWGGPTSRAAAALQVSISDLFIPLIGPTAAGMAAVFVAAWFIGRGERRRLILAPDGSAAEDPTRVVDKSNSVLPARRARLWVFNAILTLVTLVALVVEILPLPVIFLIACAVALVVNVPDAHEQRERLTTHGSAAMVMVTTVIAAGMFTGIMTGSGMLSAMARSMVDLLPPGALEHVPVILAVTSMPLSLAFDPDSFYFGVLPVLAHAAEGAGGSAVEVGRAALLGQMTTGFPVSPLTPATFLLVGLANVDLADHQRRTIPYAFAISIAMTLAALAVGAVHW
jgi:CitMHS family citrate-Mg2+:H+ or citrate-Ca2+:H+ symporter